MAWFTDSDLLDLAGSRSYERGTGYVTAVRNLRDLPDGVVATVTGTHDYRVRLYRTGGELTGECSCPYGDEGNFCKHCVAVGLRLLTEGAGVEDGYEDEDQERYGDGGEADIVAFLTAMEHDELVDLVWQQACDNPTLYQALRLRAAASADEPDLGLLRTQVDRLRVNDFIGYGDEEPYADGAYAVLNALESMIPEHAAAVQPLLRQAVIHLGAAVEQCESEGVSISDAASQAWEVYLDACAADPPDPGELGRWIAWFRLEGPGWPAVELDDYIDLLGDPGMSAYWKVLSDANKVDPTGYRVRAAREELIAASGDVDAIIGCRAEDLSGPHRYVGIARILCEHDRACEAIDWLERGRSLLGAGSEAGWQGKELVDLLCKLYAEAGRHAEAVAVREEHLRTSKTLEAYKDLRGAVENAVAAGATGTPPGWDVVRPNALDVLRKGASGPSAWHAVGQFVGALLDEDEIDEAWELVTRQRCDEQVSIAVAVRRGRTHPADAVAVLMPVVEQAVAGTNRAGYQRAAGLLAALRDLPAIGDTDFANRLERLKEAHRRKPSFLAELRQRDL